MIQEFFKPEPSLVDLAGLVLDRDVNHVDRYSAFMRLCDRLPELDGLSWTQITRADRDKITKALWTFQR